MGDALLPSALAEVGPEGDAVPLAVEFDVPCVALGIVLFALLNLFAPSALGSLFVPVLDDVPDVSVSVPAFLASEEASASVDFD